MGKVILDVTMSLDGFIAGPNDEIEPLHNWMVDGRDRLGAELLAQSRAGAGAVIMGRRTFDIIDGGRGRVAPDEGQSSLPVFVLAAEGRGTVTKGATSFTFVTCGFEAALAEARTAAKDRNIAVMGANITQQCLQAGLLDEMEIHIAPVLLGAGVRLFDHIDNGRIALQGTRVIESFGVTHLRFNVLGRSQPAARGIYPILMDFRDSTRRGV
jgi:dihydrofolate reductase